MTNPDPDPDPAAPRLLPGDVVRLYAGGPRMHVTGGRSERVAVSLFLHPDPGGPECFPQLLFPECLLERLARPAPPPPGFAPAEGDLVQLVAPVGFEPCPAMGVLRPEDPARPLGVYCVWYDPASRQILRRLIPPLHLRPAASPPPFRGLEPPPRCTHETGSRTTFRQPGE